MNDKFKQFLRLAFLASFSLMIFSCNSFSELSKDNVKSNEDGFLIINKKAGLQATFFGDFVFANNMKEYKKLNPTSKPIFKNIVIYGKTKIEPFYEVYVVQGKPVIPDNFIVKEEIFKNETYSFIISKDAPQYDLDYLKANFKDFFDE